MSTLAAFPPATASTDADATRAAVGVFDSGIGGLSVLRELRLQLPLVPMHYVADAGYAPYGERSEGYVVDRSVRIARHLLAQGAGVIVVACNTATAAAVQTLRATWPRLAVVGVEPGLKPAVAATRNGHIGVLATPATLASDKFHALLDRQAGSAAVTLQPCPGLASLIERGNFDAPDLREAVEAFCRPLQAEGVDTVVLGCTHYAFVRDVIAEAMGPGVCIIDTAEAVARHAAHLHARHATPSSGAPRLRVQTTGDPDMLRGIVTAVCGEATPVEPVAID